MLNSSNTTDSQNNQSLSASQASTQPNQSGTIYTATKGTEEDPPVVSVAEQPGQVIPASLQETHVLDHITTLI